MVEYIKQKLQNLEKQKDMEPIMKAGKLSFGMDQREYGHLPSWKDLVRQKKLMMKMAWYMGIIDALFIVFFISDIWQKIEENWIRGIAIWLSFSAIVLFLHFVWTYQSMFIQFRQTEREVRKLIYEDLLHEMEKKEKQ